MEERLTLLIDGDPEEDYAVVLRFTGTFQDWSMFGIISEIAIAQGYVVKIRPAMDDEPDNLKYMRELWSKDFNE